MEYLWKNFQNMLPGELDRIGFIDVPVLGSSSELLPARRKGRGSKGLRKAENRWFWQKQWLLDLLSG